MAFRFKHFEERIERVAARHKDMPAEKVLLTRMFFYVFRALEDNANHFLADHALTHTHYIALMMVYASEGHTLNPCALSDALQASRPNVTRLVDELVEKGWVERRGSAEDRRRIELSLTPAGVTLLETLLPRNWTRINDIWADFSADEIAMTERILRRLLSRLGDQKDEGDENPCPA